MNGPVGCGQARVTRCRFEKSERTIVEGQDLDVTAFLRKNQDKIIPIPALTGTVLAHFMVQIGVMRRSGAFTLVELMIAVSIIALVAVIALPSYLRAREQAQNAKFVNALRAATGAFEMYNVEHNNFPPDANRGIVPAGMALYFGPTFDWTAPTPVGGKWDWDNDVFGFRAGVSVIDSSAQATQFIDVDRKIDDGNLSQGHFQNTASARYTYILE